MKYLGLFDENKKEEKIPIENKFEVSAINFEGFELCRFTSLELCIYSI
jgi:hypothetical protein